MSRGHNWKDDDALAVRERERRESIVHGLRMAGWSRMDAEDEALARIEKLRNKGYLSPSERRGGETEPTSQQDWRRDAFP